MGFSATFPTNTEGYLSVPCFWVRFRTRVAMGQETGALIVVFNFLYNSIFHGGEKLQFFTIFFFAAKMFTNFRKTVWIFRISSLFLRFFLPF